MLKVVATVAALSFLLGCTLPTSPAADPVLWLAVDGQAGAVGRKRRPTKPSPHPTERPPVLRLYEASRTCPPNVPMPAEEHLRPYCTVTVVCETTWDTSSHDLQLQLTPGISVGFIELWRKFRYDDGMRVVGELTTSGVSLPHVLQVSCIQGPFIKSREWTVY